jgi:hypothetical protein
MHERALSRSRRAEDRDPFFVMDREVHAVKHRHLDTPELVGLADALDL